MCIMTRHRIISNGFEYHNALTICICFAFDGHQVEHGFRFWHRFAIISYGALGAHTVLGNRSIAVTDIGHIVVVYLLDLIDVIDVVDVVGIVDVVYVADIVNGVHMVVVSALTSGMNFIDIAHL